VLGVVALLLLSWVGPFRVVVSSSMVPALMPGDALILDHSPGNISVGSIITYEKNGKLITHRVVAADDSGLRTKGDNNPAADAWLVSEEHVVGVLKWRVPYLGHVLFAMRSSLGWLVLIVCPAVWLISDEVKKVRAKLRTHTEEAG